MEWDEKALCSIDAALDRLIANATMLQRIASNQERDRLERDQDRLLNYVTQIDQVVDEEIKRKQLQQSPRLYSKIQQKTTRLSRLNSRLLRKNTSKLD